MCMINLDLRNEKLKGGMRGKENSKSNTNFVI